jgi:hypothetical protein
MKVKRRSHRAKAEPAPRQHDTRPTELLELLDELDEHEKPSTVKVADEESKLIVTRDGAVAFELSDAECEKVFNTIDTAYQFADLFPDSDNVSLRFVGVTLDEEVLNTLRDVFSKVF